MPPRLIVSLLAVTLATLTGAVAWLLADNQALRAEVRALQQAARTTVAPATARRDPALSESGTAAVGASAAASATPALDVTRVEHRPARAVSPFAPAASAPVAAASPATLEEALDAFRARSGSR